MFEKIEKLGFKITKDQGSVSIESDLHESCPDCGLIECYGDCEDCTEDTDDSLGRQHWNNALDGVESLLMALAGAGYDMDDKKMLEAVKTTVDGIASNTK